MTQEIGSVVGLQATTRIATSALPGAPVLPVSERRQHTVTSRLLGTLTGRSRARCESGGSTRSAADCYAH